MHVIVSLYYFYVNIFCQELHGRIFLEKTLDRYSHIWGVLLSLGETHLQSIQNLQSSSCCCCKRNLIFLLGLKKKTVWHTHMSYTFHNKCCLPSLEISYKNIVNSQIDKAAKATLNWDPICKLIKAHSDTGPWSPLICQLMCPE